MSGNLIRKRSTWRLYDCLPGGSTNKFTQLIAQALRVETKRLPKYAGIVPIDLDDLAPEVAKAALHQAVDAPLLSLCITRPDDTLT